MEEYGPCYAVRASKVLTAQEKLLYIEIFSRTDSQNNCYRTNKFFADFFDVDERTIRRWLRNLQDNDFLFVGFDKSKNVRLLSPLLGKSQAIVLDERVKKFAEAFPDRKTNNISTLPEWFDVDLVISSIKESSYLKSHSNIGLRSCVNNYIQITSGGYKDSTKDRSRDGQIRRAFYDLNGGKKND